MTRMLFTLLTAGTVISGAAGAFAQDSVCEDEIDPGTAAESDSFSLSCQSDELEYATVDCTTSDTGEVVSCSYWVDDPGDYCAESVSCNVMFLSEDDEIIDQVYVEEGGGMDQGASGQWSKTRIECECSEWW